MDTNLTDAQFERILPFLQNHPHVYVGNLQRCRLFLNAVLWLLRTGCQWRYLPCHFGRWNSIYKRFCAWSSHGVFAHLLEQLAQDADLEWLSIDSTIIRAHMCAAGASRSAGGQNAQSLGRSRGGFTTKVHDVKVDSHGNPLSLVLTASQRHDTQGYALLRQQADSSAKCVLADKGYDSQAIRKDLQQIGVEAVIPSKSNRKNKIEHDRQIYQHRHVVECFINKIKWYRRVLTRYDKLDSSYLAWLHIASCLVWLR